MTVNPREKAVDHFLLLEQLLEDAKKHIENSVSDAEKRENALKRLGSPVRARVREAPALIVDSGLYGFLAFYASKADLELAERVHKAAKDEENLDLDDEIVKELTEGGKGYSVVLGLVTAFLDEASILPDNGSTYMRRLAEIIKRFAVKPGQAAGVQLLLIEYLVNLKRLVEARIKE